VRLVTPLGSVETGADRAAADFVRALQPLLGRHIPD
jgi:hypothetical protein